MQIVESKVKDNDFYISTRKDESAISNLTIIYSVTSSKRSFKIEKERVRI